MRRVLVAFGRQSGREVKWGARLAALVGIGVGFAVLGPSVVRADDPPANSAAVSDSLAELARRIDVLAGEIERERLGPAAPAAEEGRHGFGPAASKVYRTDHGVSVGGYGEMLYQNFDDERDDDTEAGLVDQLDFLRGVLYFGYKWSDRWLFNSEVEYEHANTGEGGEAAIEFAYVDYLRRPEFGVRAGLLLIPMGLVNELHEPTVFHGARRPLVEDQIIPTTWRENGAGIYGQTSSLSYRSYVVAGFDASGFSADEGIREGRQEGAESLAEDFGWVGRLDYVGRPGLLAGGSVYAGQSGQGIESTTGDVLDVGTVIVEGHVDWNWKGLGFRALGAQSTLDDVADLNGALGLTGAESIGEKQTGWYVEGSYDLLAGRVKGQQALVPFVRYEQLDTQAEVPSGFTRNPANEREVLTVGADFRPLDPVVVKMEYQDLSDEADTATDQFNVSLGYIF
jgi:hypothetical protein